MSINNGANYKNSANYKNTDIGQRSSGQKKHTKGIIALLVTLVIALTALVAVLLFALSDDGEPQKANIVVPEETTVEMFVDCELEIPMYEEADFDSSIIEEIPAGTSVYVYPEEKNNFTKINYNGIDGYVESKYISVERPYVWEYDENDVKMLVDDALYGFTNAITQKDINLLIKYLDKEALNSAYSIYEDSIKKARREEVLSAEYYDVKRISKTQVTVVRESVIRVYNYSGNVRDVEEKYLTTVENTGSGMKIIKFENLN